MSTDKKFTKAYLPKIIELGEFLGALLDKLAGPLIKVGVSLAKYFLAPLATIASALDSDIQKKKKKKRMHGTRTGVVRAGKGITWIISNENTDIIRIIKSLKNSGVLIDGLMELIT